MKELVDGFDIELDLSDCTQLYDYATCQEVCRQEGKDWDKTQFTGLGGTDHIGEEDENMMLQVKSLIFTFYHVQAVAWVHQLFLFLQSVKTLSCSPDQIIQIYALYPSTHGDLKTLSTMP